MAAKVPLWVKVGQDTVHTGTGVPVHARKITAYFGPASSANDIDNGDTWAHGVSNVIAWSTQVVSGGGQLSSADTAGTATFTASGANQEVIYTIWSPQ